MDTFGGKLRSSRESKGYSLEQVARDTNIAKKFLIALEEEDFSIFPGEPYLVGFLRNYSDYLGLDSVQIVALHRNMKLQEQPVPIEELLDTGKSKLPIIMVIIIATILAGTGGYFLYNYISNKPEVILVEELEEIEETSNIYSIDISEVDSEDWFQEGGELEIRLFNDVYTIEIKSVSTNVILSLPTGEVVINLGDEKSLDLTGDNTPDILLTVKDIDLSKKSAAIMFSSIKSIAEEPELSEISEQGSSNIASRNQDITVILNAQTPEPFIIKVVFRGNTLLRYLTDRGERIEKYFDKGETLRLDVNREVMLWIANGGSFKAKISGIDVSLGRSGEVSTNLIKWNKNTDSGKYELQMIPVY